MIRYITSSIPYVNGAPHLGHVLEFIQVDALARYWRAHGDQVRAQTGTDDNSLKNVRAAQALGQAVETYVTSMSDQFKSLLTALDLTFDDFIRTREKRHLQGAQKLWSMMKAGDVYKKTYQGMYCVGCEAFYTADEAPSWICRIHQKPLEAVSEENYFFRLSAYQQQLEELITSDRLRIAPESRKNEALGYLRQGLEDFSISRSMARAENWGVPVPNDPTQVMYVWVDALSNYITALDFATSNEAFETFWSPTTARVHVIGKDILRFHAIYWPAFLLSAGIVPPSEIFVHGHITVDGQKMSKSLGNVIAPEYLLNKYGADTMRYLLLRDMPCGEDIDLTKVRLEERYNELADSLGNLVGRVATMVNKYMDGIVPELAFSEAQLHDQALCRAISNYDFKLYLDTIMLVVHQANEKVDKDAPFKLMKTNVEAAKTSLTELVAILRWLGSALMPIMPKAATEIVARYQGVVTVGPSLWPKAEIKQA